MRKPLRILFVIIILLLAGWGVLRLVEAKRTSVAVDTAPVVTLITPSPSPVPTAPPTVAPTPVPTLPPAISLSVPFTSQAPEGNWDAVHEEACEEASVLMAEWFVQKKTGEKTADYTNRIPVREAEAALQSMVAWQKAKFGYFESTTLDQVAMMLKDEAGVTNFEKIANPTIQDIKEELAAGRILIVPAAGRLLNNPNFTPPGPAYHMLVLRGYNADGFIANDPGTRKGESYLYPFATLMESIHDWTGDPQTVTQGKRVVLSISQ